MLEYKQKRNNERTPFAGVYKFVCVRGACRCEDTMLAKLGAVHIISEA